MKRIFLMVELVAALALALISVTFLLWAIPSSIASYMSLASAIGEEGIGSMSAGISEMFVLSLVMPFPSVLLWSACGRLAAEGQTVMARHRRLHGIAVLAVPPVLIAISTIGYNLLLGMINEIQSALVEPPRSSNWIWAALAEMMVVDLGLLALNLMQLFSVVTAFKILRRGNQPAS